MANFNLINTQNPIVQTVSASTYSLVSCSTVMPVDDTIPQNTEGTEVLTVSITPHSTTNILQISFYGVVGGGTGLLTAAVALFQDSTANALAATGLNETLRTSGSIVYMMAAGTTSSTTFKIRAGPSAAGAIYINGNYLIGRIYGGVAATSLRVTEYRN